MTIRECGLVWGSASNWASSAQGGTLEGAAFFMLPGGVTGQRVGAGESQKDGNALCSLGPELPQVKSPSIDKIFSFLVLRFISGGRGTD